MAFESIFIFFKLMILMCNSIRKQNHIIVIVILCNNQTYVLIHFPFWRLIILCTQMTLNTRRVATAKTAIVRVATNPPSFTKLNESVWGDSVTREVRILSESSYGKF